MMTAERTAREEMIQLAVETGGNREIAEHMAETMTDEQVEAAVIAFRELAAERDALRARLAANRALMQAVCPPATWKTADARYDVARRAVKIVEAWAAEHGVTVDDIAATLVAEYRTIKDEIERWNDHDPRFNGYAPGQTFYAFKHSLKAAVDTLKADEHRAEAARRRDEQDAAWAKRGLVRCDRCDGQGGREDWPGFTCFDCGGRCAVEDDHKH